MEDTPPFAERGLFGPEDVTVMRAALAEACELAEVPADNEPVVDALAARIISGAKAGIRDRDELVAYAIRSVEGD